MRIASTSKALRLGLTVALPALFLVTAAAQDSGPSAGEIIKKHLDARGGVDKMKALNTAKITGKLVMMGGQMEAPFTLIIKRPSSMHMAMEIQGKSLVQGYDGTTAWMINPFQGGDDAQKMGEDEAAEMADGADIDGSLVDYKSKGHTVESMGKEDVEGTAAYKLKVTKKSGKVEYIYIDAQSYMEIKTASKMKMMGTEMDVESFPSNYKPVAGVMTPFAVDRKSNGKSIMTMTMDTIEPNVPVEDAIFQMPAKQPEKKEAK
jgi:hypothetical protein